jgi:DHA1 family bicyclomycin/chloramphenicol resistance-like MFS transporter
LAGAFAFSGLLVYVAGSPIMFMEVFDVEPSVFGAIFAGLSVGFIGSNQINVLLLRRFTSDQIFRASLWVECPAAILFLVGTYFGWFGLASTVALLFIILFSLGLAYPNAAALAMAPFDRNIGSASAMLGFLQVGVSSIASASIGFFDSQSVTPIAFILALSSCLGFVILVVGKRKIPQLKFLEESGANPVVH